MDKEEEKRQLLSGGAAEDSNDSHGFGTKESPPTYNSVIQSPSDEPPSGNKVSIFFDTYGHRIPGYGMVKMVRGVKVYALYVLFMMLMAYLLNQLDRYTLPIVTTSAGYDLHYGDLACMPRRHLSKHLFNESGVPYNLTDDCTEGDVKTDGDLCLNITFIHNTTTIHVCEYSHTGKGLVYQIVAGPVFNNLYPLAGIFTGFLADFGRRTVWLVIAVTFWSIITGLTGFAKTYWHLVVLRALLAIGAAGCTPFAVSILGDYFPPVFRGSAMGIYYFGVYIGYSLSFAIGSGITKVLNWRWVFFISGMMGLVVAPIILFTVKEPKRTKSEQADKPNEEKKLSFGRRIIKLLITFLLPGMFTLVIGGGIRNAGGYVWAYNTELFFEDSGYSPEHIQSFMSWIPLVGGSLGAVTGGLISDVLVKGRGPYMRIWVLIVSQIAAAPFAAGALYLPNPWCFLSLIPSNIIGEMWIGVTTAIVVDLAPSKIRTGAIGLYLFIITVIGGNFNLIVDPIKQGFETHLSELASYRWALLFTFPGVYAISSIWFLMSFFLMRVDLKIKAWLERKEQDVTVAEPYIQDEDGGENPDKAV